MGFVVQQATLSYVCLARKVRMHSCISISEDVHTFIIHIIVCTICVAQSIIVYVCLLVIVSCNVGCAELPICHMQYARTTEFDNDS